MTKFSGYLVLADVSGFSAYLADVELTHAEQILAELYGTLMRQLQPYMNDAMIEGGALFGHLPDSQAPHGEIMLDFVETSYAAFRNQLLTMKHNLTCQCRACQNVSSLDLKFFVHHGEYLRHELNDQIDMMGLDVSLIRSRVLKPSVAESTGWRGLALFTAPALAQLDLDSVDLPLHSQIVTVETYGDVKTYSLDLQARYEARKAANPVLIEATEANLAGDVEIPAPAAQVWEWITTPEKRTLWMEGRRWSARQRFAGRSGPGASNHCDHLGGHVTEQVLDWRPFEHYTSEFVSQPGSVKVRSIFLLKALPNHHTLLTWRIKFDAPAWLSWLFSAFMEGGLHQDLACLQKKLVQSQIENSQL